MRKVIAILTPYIFFDRNGKKAKIIDELPYADIESIIALKIFALREAKGKRGFKDIDDIVALMKVKDQV